MLKPRPRGAVALAEDFTRKVLEFEPLPMPCDDPALAEGAVVVRSRAMGIGNRLHCVGGDGWRVQVVVSAIFQEVSHQEDVLRAISERGR